MARARGTTTEETLTVDGVVLNTYAKNIESLAGRLIAPSKRTSNVVVSGRHGAVRVRGKKYDQNVIALPMWVIGCEDDGSVPSDTTERRLFFRNIDQLSHLFVRDALLDVRHTLPDGSVRQCFAEVLDSIDFSSDTAHPLGKFGVSLVLSDPFWQDVDERVADVAAVGQSVTLGEFRGATAPMEDLTAELTGPWSSPVLTFADDSWVAYDEAIPAGKGIKIDAATWSLTGVGGLTPSLSKLRYGGTSSHWIAIPGAGEDVPEIRLAGSARTSDTRLTLQGRRKFLVG